MRTTLNEVLYWAMGDVVEYGGYWSSEEYDSDYAWVVGMEVGFTLDRSRSKLSYYYVRAVSDF